MNEESTQPLEQANTSTQGIATLQRIHTHLSTTSLPLETSEISGQRTMLRRTQNQIVDYLLPKLTSIDAPLTVVIGGSTGAGKSTLVNSLLGEKISTSGAVRPTTRQPVLIHRAEDAQALTPERLLPGLERITRDGNHTATVGEARSTTDQILTVATDSVPEGIALIDAPDIDSVSEDNRRLANQLLEAADLWLFVTTANRYADAVPWEVLHRAAKRNITVAVVLNRVPEGAEEEIENDLRRMLTEAGINSALLHTITEQERDEQGMLPAAALLPLIYWLRELGADGAERSRIIKQTLAGALASLSGSLQEIAAAQASQEQVKNQLGQVIDKNYRQAEEAIIASTQDGALLRGEVLARWQDFVGTGEFFRSLENGIGRLRDKVSSFMKGQPREAVKVEQALEVGLHAVIVEESQAAFDRVIRSWKEERSGRQLLTEHNLSVQNQNYSQQVADAIRAWQEDVLEMIREEGASKRSKARFLSLGVNAMAVILMIAVFSMTGGLTGLEAGIAGGSGVVGTKLLEAVFGEDAVRRMAARARENLITRIQEVTALHRQQLENILNGIELTPSSHQLDQDAADIAVLAAEMEH